MSSTTPRAILEVAYEEAAQAYLASLPPEHFMEATAQATQRKITLESFDLLRVRRPEVNVFNELLVQYPRPRRRFGQVVPDNMVVLTRERIQASTSFNVPLEPAGPFWVLEYVSKHTKRKDYEDSFIKYERDLKVPYYLLFYPDTQDLTLYRHSGRKYSSIPPNALDRHAIPELDVEVGLLNGWVRFWYQAGLLPLPADLARALDEAHQRARKEKRRADKEKAARLKAEQELTRLRAQLKRFDPRLADEAE